LLLGRRGAAARRTGTSADLLVVGLGNPGAQYAGTRHNLGAEVAELLAARYGTKLRPERGLAAVFATCDVAGKTLALAVPNTYMNESGLAVRGLVRRCGIEDGLEHLVVVHDELDLPTATVRLKVGGGVAGHNGLKSVRAHLHSDGFVRVRIGIDKAPGQMAGADWVLRRPGRKERELLDVAVEVAADAVEAILAEGPHAAMNAYNGRKPEPLG
jgi:peptidyl-tRNA hydrolase, PTH1 family